MSSGWLSSIRARTTIWLSAAVSTSLLLVIAVLRRKRQLRCPDNRRKLETEDLPYVDSAESFQPEAEPHHSGAASEVMGLLQQDHAHPFALEEQPMWPMQMVSAAQPPQTINVNGELAGLPFGAVVHITNCFAEVDLCFPWRVQSPSVATGTGFCIGGRQIITNDHVIRSHTSIRVQRHGVPGNYEARVLVTSSLCDLALVTVDDDEFWEGVPPTKLQDAVPELDDTVVVVGYPMGATTVTLTRGIVSNVHLKDLSLTELNEKQLTVQIDAAINPGNSGGPVFNQLTREVVGVAFAAMKEAEGHGYIIPVPVLRNFIHVFEMTGDFAALPSLGLRVQALGNPSMRKRAFHGKPAHHNGVLVTALAPFSCAKEAGVRVGDVLMSVDGSVVSEDGEITFRGHERVHYSFLYTRKSVGDSVLLSLLRKKGAEDDTLEMVDIDVSLTAGKFLVPRQLWKDYKPDYVIAGGLVLLIAGVPLAAQLEHKGCFGPRQQAVLVAEQESDECDDPEEQAIIVGDCLAHELNVSYQMFMGQRLKEIDGVSVQNLRHAADLLQRAVSESKSFAVLSFHKYKPTAVFEIAALLAATPTILQQHKIPSWTSLPGLTLGAGTSMIGA